MPKSTEKNPKKRIWPSLNSVTFLNVSLQMLGNMRGKIPSNKKNRPNAIAKVSGNYFFSDPRRYLKKSELASRTIMSSFPLKLFL